MTSDLLIIPGQLISFQSLKDLTLKLVFETGEPTPAQMTSVMHSLQKAGYLAFNPDPFKEREKEMLSSLRVDYDDTEKSKAQRLRAVLFRLWEQNHEGYEIPDDHYNHYLEKIIMHYKNKLD